VSELITVAGSRRERKEKGGQGGRPGQKAGFRHTADLECGSVAIYGVLASLFCPRLDLAAFLYARLAAFFSSAFTCLRFIIEASDDLPPITPADNPSRFIERCKLE
jgi:hypothetical protein